MQNDLVCKQRLQVFRLALENIPLLIDYFKFVDVVVLHGGCQQDEAKQVEHIWYEFVLDDEWSHVIPHQLDENFYRVLLVHFVSCFKIQESNEFGGVVTCEDPVKVKGLDFYFSEGILHVILFKAKIVLLDNLVTLLNLKLFFLLEKII